MTHLQQPFAEVRTDEAGAASDQKIHGRRRYSTGEGLAMKGEGGEIPNAKPQTPKKSEVRMPKPERSPIVDVRTRRGLAFLLCGAWRIVSGSMRNPIIVALDVSTIKEAMALVKSLRA